MNKTLKIAMMSFYSLSAIKAASPDLASISLPSTVVTLLKAADAAIVNRNWDAVKSMIPSVKEDAQSNDVVNAIKRITHHHLENFAALPADYNHDSLYQDMQRVQKASYALTKKTEVTIKEHVDDFFKQSQLRFLKPKEKQLIIADLLTLKSWPGSGVMKQYEQFCLAAFNNTSLSDIPYLCIIPNAAAPFPNAAPNFGFAGNPFPYAAPNFGVAGNHFPNAAPNFGCAGNPFPYAAPNFDNIPGLYELCFKTLQENPKRLDWKKLSSFFKKYSEIDKKTLWSIYLSFSCDIKCDDFMNNYGMLLNKNLLIDRVTKENINVSHIDFLRLYNNNIDIRTFLEGIKNAILPVFYFPLFRHENNLAENLLDVYIDFEHNNQTEQNAFLNWVEPISSHSEKKIDFLAYKALYYAFSNKQDRETFMSWISQFLSIKETQNDLMDLVKKLIETYTAFSNDEERNAFIIWAKPLISREPITATLLSGADIPREKINRETKNTQSIEKYRILKNVYKSYSSDIQRNAFLAWVEPLFKNKRIKIPSINKLNDVYVAFSNNDERNAFLNWANPIINQNKEIDITQLKDVYVAFSNNDKRNAFLNWANPIINQNEEIDITQLKDVYVAFSNNHERNAFLNWANPIIAVNKKINITELKDVYVAFSNNHERNAFTRFCSRFHLSDFSCIFDTVLPIYEDSSKREKLISFSIFYGGIFPRGISFMHINPFEIIRQFLSNETLGTMRKFSALVDQPEQHILRSVIETKLGDFLPAYDLRDPFLQKITQQDMQNAHTLEGVYLREIDCLKTAVAKNGYVKTVSCDTLTLHNNHEKVENYQTNESVQDFVRYLNTEFKTDEPTVNLDGKIISAQSAIQLVKETLGICQNDASTHLLFGPYLGRSALYAVPKSAKGDELLGHVWHLIKTSTSDEKELALRKRNVVLAILNGIDIYGHAAYINCQTRTTAELLKMACFYLGNDSVLRKIVIGGTDAKETITNEEIEQRIEMAQEKAAHIFQSIKRDNAHKIAALFENGTEPELFEIYKIYYDALYRRTTTINPDGSIDYRKDAHVLTRDQSGNMVSAHNADGSLKDTPEIVYYQTEFMIIEKEFTGYLEEEYQGQIGRRY
ncbi:MAG: hypothetical protein HEEMFOPI_01399 [Holosporales bacterium]